ncbi:MAG: 7TM diverse intracellular signaling domain-containing protein [Campylobacterota bacterium]|nr:7TM diverse intracellular signaling domain-containing protein [Campylobacterota bacterium]
MNIRILMILTFFYNFTIASVVIDNHKNRYDNFSIQYHYDKSNDLSIQNIEQHKFKKTTSNSFTFGYKDEYIWFKIEIENLSDKQNYILTFSEAIWKEFNLYYKKDGVFIEDLNGLDIPLNKRSIKDVNPAFNIDIDKQTTKVFYIKAKTIASQIGRFEIVTNEEYYNPSKITTTDIYIIFAFILITIIMLNIYSYFLTKDNTYMYYILYVIASVIFSSMHSGSYLILGFEGWNEGLHVVGAFVILFLLLFTNKFLDLKNQLPLVHKFFMFSAIVFILFALLIYNNIAYSSVLFNIYSALFFMILFFAVIKIFLKGVITAKYYLIALFVFAPLMGLMIATFNTFLNYSDFARHSFLAGALIEIIFFTLLLASKYRSLTLEKIKIQDELIFEKNNNETKLKNEIDKQTKKLLEIANKFKFATDNALAGFWEIDLDTNKVSFSNGWFEFLGYDRKDFLSITTEETIHKIIHKEDLDSVLKAVNDFINGKIKKYNVEFRVLHKDGTVTWINASGAIYKNKFFGFHIDIDDLKNANLKIIEQSKMVSMGEMIGNIAHQWRQPLSVISTASTGMKLQKELDMLSDKSFYEMCDSINNNAQYLSKTIDDFKNFIKGDMTKKTFVLKDQIDSFLNLVNGSIKSHNIKIILNLDETIKINGYENELTQSLINIFNNAKDILVEKKIDEKLIFISTFVKKDKATIKIKDNGDGIPENIISKIFEPYFTTKHQSQGTGLGLHMTYNLIVDGMNGSIYVENINYNYKGNKHIGAEFTITLAM